MYDYDRYWCTRQHNTCNVPQLLLHGETPMGTASILLTQVKSAVHQVNYGDTVAIQHAYTSMDFMIHTCAYKQPSDTALAADKYHPREKYAGRKVHKHTFKKREKAISQLKITSPSFTSTTCSSLTTTAEAVCSGAIPTPVR